LGSEAREVSGVEGTDPAGAPLDRGVTIRSIVFGFFLAVAISLLGNTVRYILHASFMAYSHMPMGNLILSLFSIVMCSILARVAGKSFAFSPSEWITIFSMGLISSLGPTYGVSGYLVGVMVTPYYFATPENRWEEFLHPYLPEWIIPANREGAMTWFYDGLPTGAAIPWGVWAMPLFWWFTFICAVGLACFCASIIIHRQWSDNEKLVYPAMEPILEITTNAGVGNRLLPNFMSGRPFWIGFFLTTFVFGWNIIAWFYPTFPTFPMASGTWVSLGRQFPPLWVFVSTVVICFSYFASLEVLFSIWFFDLLFILEGGTLNRLGVNAISPNYGTGRFIWQTAGAFVGLSVWWLFISRFHLWKAVKKAIRPDSQEIDDSRELLSYRRAFICLIIAFIYTVAWLCQAGMDLHVVLVLLPTMFLVYFGVAKILADSGLIYVNPPTGAWNLTMAALGGAKAIPASTFATLYPASIAVNHFRGYTLSVGTHVNRLGDFVKGNKGMLFTGVCIAFVVGCVASTLFTVWLGYKIGGYNFEPNWLIIRAGSGGYQSAVNSIVSPEAMEKENYWFFLAGLAVMTLFNFMRYRFTWWPFHPIGFALSGTALARLTSFTIFLAWLVKFIMLRLLGASFYKRTRPFFVGTLIGYILLTTVGLIVDAIWFGKQGHTIHKWY